MFHTAKTNNIYGTIVISNKTVEKYISKTATDCYGIVSFARIGFFDYLKSIIHYRSKQVKGIKVHASGDRLYIDLAVIVKYGVSIGAVVDALKESVKYKVERFTGMIVDTINVNVMGVER